LSHEIDMTRSFIDTRFEQLITSLRSGHFDVVASALYITPERAKLVDYIAYFTTGTRSSPDQVRRPQPTPQHSADTAWP